MVKPASARCCPHPAPECSPISIECRANRRCRRRPNRNSCRENLIHGIYAATAVSGSRHSRSASRNAFPYFIHSALSPSAEGSRLNLFMSLLYRVFLRLFNSKAPRHITGRVLRLWISTVPIPRGFTAFSRRCCALWVRSPSMESAGFELYTVAQRRQSTVYSICVSILRSGKAAVFRTKAVRAKNAAFVAFNLYSPPFSPPNA